MDDLESTVVAGTRGRATRDWAFLLSAQAFSTLGTQITAVVLPAVAVLVLGSGIGSATLLVVAEFLPGAVLGPFGGVLIDRFRLRTLLASLDLLRALAVLVAAGGIAAGLHSIWVLYALAAVLGTAAAVFDSGAETAVPALVPERDLLHANAMRVGLLNLVRIGGPGLGGLLAAISSASAPLMITACAFVMSAGCVATLRSPRLRILGKSRNPDEEGILPQLREAVRHLRGDLVLRRGVLGTATLNIAGSGIGALFFVYAYRQLLLGPGQVGLTLSAFSIGAVLGAVCSAWLARRLGTGPACVVSASVVSIAFLLVPAASWGRPVELLTAYQVLFGAGATAWTTILLSARQRRTAPRLLGRVSALMNAVTIATVPLGALAATVLAELLGPAPALLVLALAALPAPAFYAGGRFRHAERSAIEEVRV